MTASPHADLAVLQARLAAQEARLAAQAARIASLEGRRRLPRRALPLALAALLVLLTPLALRAAPFFSDLGDAAAVHRGNIQAIGDAGITTGFADPGDPTARLYSPKGLVTREEMASFLARTAGLGGNPPVANALTATNATNAANAEAVGGKRAADLLRVAQRTGPEGNKSFTEAYPAWKTILTVQVTAPSAGFVLVFGGVSLTANNEPTGCATGVCYMYARLRDPTPGGLISPLVTASINADGPVQTLATTFVFPVSTAGSRSFVLEISKNGNAGATTRSFGAEQLTALYLPFGYNGGTTLAP